jgi:nicotinate-nucleotide pyrophosphorylase (carboxylating)
MTPVQIVENALTEDIGSGDITTTLCVPAELTARARIIARQPLVAAGVSFLAFLFDDLDLRSRDGDRLNKNDEIAMVRGPARYLLTRERVALNFLQRLSGIATLTRKYVDAIAGTNCRILDTRKTTPGLRMLEKMATMAGGAQNHRMGLYDAILIKNNHITAAGGVREALTLTKNTGLPVEIEVRTIAELHEALECGATHLLLDNLTPPAAASWIRTIAGRATVELSGGITLRTVRAYAETGADYISVGALTHSAPAADINFRLELDR